MAKHFAKPSQAVFFLKRGRRDLRFLRRRRLVGDTWHGRRWLTQILMMPVSGQDENEDEPAKARQPTEASEVAKVCFFPGGIFSQVSWLFSRFSQWLFFFMVMFPTNLLWFSNGFGAQICTRLRHGKHGHFQVNLQHPRWIPRQAESGSRLSAWQ